MYVCYLHLSNTIYKDGKVGPSADHHYSFCRVVLVAGQSGHVCVCVVLVHTTCPEFISAFCSESLCL